MNFTCTLPFAEHDAAVLALSGVPALDLTREQLDDLFSQTRGVVATLSSLNVGMLHPPAWTPLEAAAFVNAVVPTGENTEAMNRRHFSYACTSVQTLL